MGEQAVEDLGECRVCLGTADGSHFNVVSCRACAAFFRRTISLKLDYSCRNDEQCIIEKSQRNMCRSCRFNKCKHVGMNDTAVQLMRDAIGRKKSTDCKNEISLKSVTKEKNSMMFTKSMLSKAPVIGTGAGHSLYSAFTSETRTIVTNPMFQTPQSFSPQQKTLQMTTLPKMIEGYNHFLMIRKTTNSLLEKEEFLKLLKAQTKELRASNFDSAKKVCQLEAHLVTDIVNTYFLPFNDLSYEDKVTLFKNFFCFFSHTDRAYQSYEKFKQDKANDKMWMPDGGYIKRSELGKFYENAEGVHSSPEDAAKIFLPAMDYILDVIIDHMRRISINETEYMALLGFCLWDDAVPGISCSAKSVILETQKNILSDLHHFYVSQNFQINQISSRIGQLMLLVPKLTKCVIMLRENSVLAEMFNFYEADVCCKSFKEEAVPVECGTVVHTHPHPHD